jgi:hypothetical protein
VVMGFTLLSPLLSLLFCWSLPSTRWREGHERGIEGFKTGFKQKLLKLDLI